MPSSVISYIAYKPVTKTLIIKFVSGMVYSYQNVPDRQYANLKKAGSKGVYFNKYIKGLYNFEKIIEKTLPATQSAYNKNKKGI